MQIEPSPTVGIDLFIVSAGIDFPMGREWRNELAP